MSRLAFAVSVLQIVASTFLARAAEPPTAELSAVIGEQTIPIRLHATIDKQPVAKLWTDFYERLFREFDRDGDGTLSTAERGRCPSAEWLRSQVRGDFVNVPSTGVAAAGFFGSAKKLTSEEFAAAYRRSGLIGIDLRPTPAPKRDDRTNRVLFNALAGGATTLTVAAFPRAYETMRRWDLDDDERISEAELATGARRVKSEMAPVTLTIVEPARIERAAVTADLEWLDFETPVYDVDVPPGKDLVRLLNLNQETTPRVVAGQAELNVDVMPGLGAATFASARQELRQNFETDDADGNGNLNEAEINASPNSATWQVLRTAADRDDDRRLALTELQRWLTVLEIAATSRIEAVLIDHGRPLMMRLDEDDDGRLTLRESSEGWLKVREWNRDQDRELTWNEVPRLATLLLSRGTAKSLTVHPYEAWVCGGVVGVDNLKPHIPTWFLKMDRNADGDVSPREFLGPTEAFQKLDADRNGLVDRSEANRR